MKNWKKYAAIIGVIALLAIFCLPMYFALKGDFSQKAFMASLFTVLFVAIMTGKHIWTALDLNRPKGNESQRQLFKALSGMNVTEAYMKRMFI